MIKGSLVLAGAILFAAIITNAATALTMSAEFIETISERGSNRGTCYQMSNKIITADGKIFVGWLDYYAGSGDRPLPGPRIRVYNKPTDTEPGSWDDTVALGTWWDNHGGPAITMDSQGYLYAIFGAHDSPFRFKKSSAPYDVSSWEMETKPDGVSDLLEEAIYGNTFVYMTETGLELADTDRDGWIDIVEKLVYGNLELFHDADRDHFMDKIEVLMYGKYTTVNMRTNGIKTDDDADGTFDIYEIIINGDLNGPAIDGSDDDGDGVWDVLEIEMYETLEVDMTEEGLLTDNDEDELSDVYEFLIFTEFDIFNGDQDSDADGVSDDIEIALYGSSEAVDMQQYGILTNNDSSEDNYPDIIEMILNGNLADTVIEGYNRDNDEVLVGAEATYPSLVIDSEDTLHLTYREHDYNNCRWQHEHDCVYGLVYRRKVKGEEWSEPMVLVWGSPNRTWGYMNFGNPIIVSSVLPVSPDSPVRMLHVAFHIFHINKVLGFGYLRSADNGLTWENAKGREMELPVNPEAPEPSDPDCFILRLENPEDYDDNLRVGNIAVDNQGYVYVSVHDSTDYSAFWRHDGNEWRKLTFLPHIKEYYPDARISTNIYPSLSMANGGMTLYAALHGQTASGIWGRRGMFLLTSEDQGETFSVEFARLDKQPLIYSPSIERPFGEEPLDGLPSLLYSTSGGRPSDIIFIKTGPPSPPKGAPANLQAVFIATYNHTRITWQYDSPIAEGLIIFRKINNSKFTEIARVNVTSTSYYDTDISSGGTYIYKVLAYNSYGESDYSNEAQVETQKFTSYGDVDGDTKITLKDALLAQRIAVGLTSNFKSWQIDAANIDRLDGVTVKDAILIGEEALKK